MNSLRLVLLTKYDFDYEAIQDVIEEMVFRVNDGEDPEEVLFDEGLEPDYIFDLLEEAKMDF